MTQGNIWRLLTLFAVPLLLGNLLQQLYNAIDAIIVGSYVGKEALAAVGSTGPLINMIIAFFMGMSTGASVLISQFFGAKDARGLHDTVHSAIFLSLVLGLALSAVGVICSPFLLEWMKTPQEILPDANEYLRVYFWGMSSLTVYNMGAAILTAVGDSRRPLYFLILSAVLNVVGDLAFVLLFHMGIAGVAWATVLAQVVSAALVIIVLLRAETDYKLIPRDLRLHRGIVQKIAGIGLPGAVQQAIISISNIVVQAYINGLGTVTVAGYSAASKLDAFITLPVQTMALVASTFVGQNLGARQVGRARRGVNISLILGLSATLVIAALALLFGRPLLRFFSTDEAVLSDGFRFMLVFVPFYFILCGTQILPGALRGAGDVRFATLACIISFVGLRQLFLFLVTKLNYSIETVGLSYPATWLIAAIAILIHYRRSDWSRFEPAQETPAEEAPTDAGG
jgi:putative MATE family efflux protein